MSDTEKDGLEENIPAEVAATQPAPSAQPVPPESPGGSPIAETERSSEADAEPAAAEQKSAPLSVGKLVLAGVSAILVLGLAAASIIWLPAKLPGLATKPPVPAAQIAVPPAVLACPAGPSSVTGEAVSPGATGSTTLGYLGAGSVGGILRFADKSEQPVPAEGVATDTKTVGARATVPGDSQVAGSVLNFAADGQVRGLTATPCRSATHTAWFAAGATTPGSALALHLSNPGQVESQVKITAWDATGPVELRRAPITVAAGASQKVLLDTVLPDAKRPVLQLTASGPGVIPTLQVTNIDGIAPAGTDLIGPAAPPAATQIIPALRLGTGDQVLRLAAPEKTAQVKVTILGERGETPVPGAEKVVVEAGTTLELTLAGLGKQAGAVKVSGDMPVVAGVRTRIVGSAHPEDPKRHFADLAWQAAVTPAESGGAAVVLPTGVSGEVMVTNPQVQAVTVTLAGQDHNLPPRSTVVVKLPPAAWQWQSDGPVVVALNLSAKTTGGQLIATLPATGGQTDTGPARVLPRS